MSGIPQPFEYNGVMDTLIGHCDRLDVDVSKYYAYLDCHNLKDAPRASTFAVWVFGVLERRAIAIAKAKPMHTEFTCELCGKVKGLGFESAMIGKCLPCYKAQNRAVESLAVRQAKINDKTPYNAKQSD